jgi:hypothetical protein
MKPERIRTRYGHDIVLALSLLIGLGMEILELSGQNAKQLVFNLIFETQAVIHEEYASPFIRIFFAGTFCAGNDSHG